MEIELPPGQQRLELDYSTAEPCSAQELVERKESENGQMGSLDEAENSLEGLRTRVLRMMHTIPELAEFDLAGLEQIPLARLRRDATRLHGVCRYHSGKRGSAGELGPADVREVGLHPQVLETQWGEYAAFLLYHEFLHALGLVKHDGLFRKLEGTWPNLEARALRNDFARHIRSVNSRWSWTCPECGWCCARSVRAAGRYRCRSCRVPLIDEPLQNPALEPNREPETELTNEQKARD